MKKSDIAVRHFTDIVKKKRLNCTQAISKAFMDEYGITEEDIKNFKKFGKGKNTDGVCGALYAAGIILNKEGMDCYAIIKAEFIDKAYSTQCKDIRKNKTLSCTECVRLVAELIEKYCLGS